MFTGREWIAEVGLYDYRNRVYSAELGRFIQTDPIRFDAGDVNLYRYVGNRSNILNDPFGLCPHDPKGDKDGDWKPNSEDDNDGIDTDGDGRDEDGNGEFEKIVEEIVGPFAFLIPVAEWAAAHETELEVTSIGLSVVVVVGSGGTAAVLMAERRAAGTFVGEVAGAASSKAAGQFLKEAAKSGKSLYP